MNEKTAILIFSRTAEAEAQAKTFLPDAKRNVKIARALVHQVHKTAETLGIPVFVSDEFQQVGNSFGQRFAHAFEAIYDLGYENIISIGNDCPELTSTHLKLAIEQLEQGNIILGPTFHHGYYLIGLNRKQFLYTEFSQVHWQTDLVQLSLTDYFIQFRTDIKFLEPLSDINSESQLLDFLKETGTKNSLFRLLFSIVFPASIPKTTAPIGSEISLSLSMDALRGPPPFYFNGN